MTEGERPRVVSRDERPTPRDGADAIVAAIVASARDALALANVAPRDVVAGGCSSPGPLDHQTGVVIETPNLVGFRDIALAERLEAGIGTKMVLDRAPCMAAT